MHFEVWKDICPKIRNIFSKTQTQLVFHLILQFHDINNSYALFLCVVFIYLFSYCYYILCLENKCLCSVDFVNFVFAFYFVSLFAFSKISVITWLCYPSLYIALTGKVIHLAFQLNSKTI